MDNKPGIRQRLVPRFAAALLGAATGAFVVAALDAAVASAASGGAPWVGLFLAELGLLAPVALVSAFAGAIAAELLLPAGFPRAWSFGGAGGAPAASASEVVYRWLLLPPLAALATLLAGRLSLKLLASEAPARAVGAGLALISAAIAAATVLVALGAARRLSERGAQPLLAKKWAALIGLSLAAVLLGLAIATGTTGGSGGPLALFGVFKRPELDLKAPGFALLLLLATVLVPPLDKLSLRLGAVLLAVLPLLLTVRASASAFEERSVALAVERAAPLGRPLLALARKLSDADRDQFSRRFGGGDCADDDPQTNPGADDVPGNGRDEDCSGADAKRIEIVRPSAAPDPAVKLAQRLPKKPNVVLITVDTLRFDLGYMGYERKITPNIDELARRSAVFEKGYALASYTSKSLPPMLIGKYGLETHRGWSHFNRFEKADTFVAERLQARGIRTISVQGHWYFMKGYGLERGFDVIDGSASPKAPQLEGDRTFTSDKLTDAAIAQLQAAELDDRQFFLWVHYTDPHSEYVKHEGFDFGTKSRDLYDGEVAFVDHHVGRLLTALNAEPFAERTLIALTSDHGEAFGEHGMIRHGFEVWEELVRVPLLLHVPKLAGARITERRSTIDLVPTLLDVFGIEQPAADAADALSGVSLLPDLFLSEGQKAAKRPVFVDMQAGPHNAERQAFIENDLKLVLSAGRTLGLYDLASDPGEKNDLSDEQPDKAKEQLERAKAFKRGLREVRVKPVP